MHISKQKKWLFGAFLVTAPNRYVARRAYDFLIERYETGSHTGLLSMDTGEIVRWTRFPYFDRHDSARMTRKCFHAERALPTFTGRQHADH